MRPVRPQIRRDRTTSARHLRMSMIHQRRWLLAAPLAGVCLVLSCSGELDPQPGPPRSQGNGGSATGSTATPGTPTGISDGVSADAAARDANSDGGISGPTVPPCPATGKGSRCPSLGTDPLACYRPCGPDAMGFKISTCVDGADLEGQCQFPSDKDYSCYKLPLRFPACPDAVALAGSLCSDPTCQPCGPTFTDSTGVSKTGYCVCSSIGHWTCGSTGSGAWPCPPDATHSNPGCN